MIRVERWLLILALMIPAGCSSSEAEPEASQTPEAPAAVAVPAALPQPPVVAPASPCEPLPPSEDPPLRLVLDAPSRGELRATLCNTSTRPQRVMVQPLAQPLVLELSHPERGRMEAYDSRSNRSSSGRILLSMFRTIEAGGELPLERRSVETDEAGKNHIHFGTLHFMDLPAGTYRARARLRARYNRTEEEGLMPDVWTGRLVSESVELRTE